MKKDDELFVVKKMHLYLVVTAIVFFVFGFAMADFLKEGFAYREAKSPSIGLRTLEPPLKAPVQQKAPEVLVSPDDDPFKGPEDAPVIIIEFSDFQCPFCERFYNATLNSLLKNYEGKVKFVYRDFPISSIHPHAQKAAEAGECAHEQGAFWKMHDKIFENQEVWSSVGPPEFKKYAREIGLDAAKFDSCLDSGKYKDEVEKDLKDGTAAGVTGTPTFFINGQRLVGAQPLSAFVSMIDAELAKAK